MRRAVALVLVLVLTPLLAPAWADADGPPLSFHRTTPRASLADAAGMLVIGVPSSRAWGVESELRRLPDVDAAVVARIAVRDGTVGEAFLRVAYYASATARTRQLAIADSAAVPYGSDELVIVPLDPPAGAVAFRVRVLARTVPGVTTSARDAITAALTLAPAAQDGLPLLSRLLP